MLRQSSFGFPLAIGGFDKLSAGYLLLPDNLKKKKTQKKPEVVAPEEEKAADWQDYLPSFGAKPSPTIVIAAPPNHQPSSLTGWGTAGAVGSGLLGAGGLAANQAANYASKRLGALDPFATDALQKANLFTSEMAKAKTPAEKLVAYTLHGSNLMRDKLFKNQQGSGMSGRSFMQSMYSNPVLQTMMSPLMGKPDSFSWSPERAQHYGEFSKGPAKAYAQLLREIKDFSDPTELLAPLKNDTRANFITRSQGAIKRLTGSIDAAEAAGDTVKAEQLRKIIGNINNNMSEQNLAARVDRRVGEYMKRYGHKATAFSPYDHHTYHGAGFGYQLEQLAKADPELAAKYPNLKNVMRQLTPQEQAKLLQKFTATELGQRAATQFAKGWGPHIQSYSNLANAMTVPKKVLDRTLSGLASVSRGGRNAALVSVPLLLGGLGLRHLGASNDAAAKEQNNKLLIDQITAALNQKRGEDTTSSPKMATAYLLPPTPSKLKKKKLQSEQEELQKLDKQAAAYVEEAFLLQRYEAQKHLGLHDFAHS